MSFLNVNYEFKSYGSYYEESYDDKLDFGIHSPYYQTHLLESWNNLLEIVEDSSKRHKGTFSKCLKELTRYNS